MHARTPILGLVLCLTLAGPVGAAGGTATDQAVSLTYPATHWSGTPLAHLTGVDATGDQVYTAGWWYRAEGDTREYPLPAPDSETYTDGWVYAVWDNLDGKGFRLEERTVPWDGEGPSGGFTTFMWVINDNASAKSFTLFHYLDPDLAATAAGDVAWSFLPRFLKFSDGATRLSYRWGDPMAQFEVGPAQTLLGKLNDAQLTTLADAGLPFGPGDVAVVTQNGPFSIAPGSYGAMGYLSYSFNAPRDHVKGDLAGVGLYGPLLLELSSPRVVHQHCLRRGVASPVNIGISALSGTTMVGIDDFDGRFDNSVVSRNPTTGSVYVGGRPISGAPTLPLNWKLSATGDFNADGKADILWRNTTSQKLVIWTMNGAAKVGSITPSPDQAVDANWEVAAAVDFNGDGQRDLLWYNQTSGKIVLWFMNASVARITGQFANPASVGNNNWKVVAAGDYGKGPGGVYDSQDVVWQNDTSRKVVIWYMDKAGNRTSGSFTTPDNFNLQPVTGPR